MPPQPANHGTGNGMLGVLPASSLTQRPRGLARADAGLCRSGAPRPAAGRAAERRHQAGRRAVHTGWIVQVGALESESEAQQRIEPPATRPAACSARPIPSPSRSSPRTTEAVPRPLRRPRARSGRSGLQDAEARRHLLHHRSQLIVDPFDIDKAGAQAPALLFCEHSSRRAHRPAFSIAAQTSRQEFAVKLS